MAKTIIGGRVGKCCFGSLIILAKSLAVSCGATDLLHLYIQVVRCTGGLLTGGGADQLSLGRDKGTDKMGAKRDLLTG